MLPRCFLNPLATFAVGTACLVGCQHRCSCVGDFAPKPLGALSDPIWQKQEENAEASDFVIHEHEFVGNTIRLNADGENHLKQIAARLPGTPFPVIVEASTMGTRATDTHGYPVHPDPELDLQRRELVVAALTNLGILEAEQRVVVGPALTPGFEDREAEAAYNRAFNGSSNFSGFGGMGFGGGFGGFGGGAGF